MAVVVAATVSVLPTLSATITVVEGKYSLLSHSSSQPYCSQCSIFRHSTIYYYSALQNAKIQSLLTMDV